MSCDPGKHLGCLFRLFKKGNLFDGNKWFDGKIRRNFKISNGNKIKKTLLAKLKFLGKISKMTMKLLKYI